MANASMDDTPSVHSHDSSNSGTEDESESGSSEPEVQTLVDGREKRSTAANRYGALIQAEEDDELEMLFQEVEEEEDVDFLGDNEDAGSDVELDSSSDDDDQGPNAPAVDDLEGEKVLQQEAKAARAKKRTAQMALTEIDGLRKKVKIDPTATVPKVASASQKSTKKKDRETWLPSDMLGPSRISLRPQTIANTEVTRARVKENDEIHAKVVAKLNKKRREREKNMPKEMTQADRLAEAEKVERRNAKSLNRWETMEKRRTEEQAAKLAALKNRKLEGPVVTYWSGVAKWLGPKLVQIGAMETNLDPPVEGKKRGRKPKSYYEALEARKEAEADISSIGTPRDQTTAGTPAPSESIFTVGSTTEPPQDLSAADSTTIRPISFAAPQGPEDFLPGIHEHASEPVETQSAGDTQRTSPSTGPTISSTDPPPPSTSSEPRSPVLSLTPAHAHEPSNSTTSPLPTLLPQLSTSTPTMAASSTVAPSPPVPGTSTRNLVILTMPSAGGSSQSTPHPASHHHHHHASLPPILAPATRKSTKLVKHTANLCAITSLPARYCDPVTELPYANATAYKKIRHLTQGGYVWSGMLGCYVGRVGEVARGVPDGFLTGTGSTAGSI